MRFEKLKEVAATLSLGSVLLAVLASGFGFVNAVGDDYRWLAYLTAVAGAAVSALMSIGVSRSLRQARTARQVFIVYSSKDLEIARTLAAKIKQAGMIPWLDIEQLTPGDVWRRTVFNALEESIAAVVILSKNLANSANAKAEIEAAIKVLHAPASAISSIVPIKIDDSATPDILKGIQWLDLGKSGSTDGLITALNRVAAAQGG